MMNRKLCPFFLLVSIFLLTVIVSACGLLQTKEWKIYTDNVYSYSIEYPSWWSYSAIEDEEAIAGAGWESPDEEAFIGVYIDRKQGRSLDEFVDWHIKRNKDFPLTYYEVLSRKVTQHKGIEAEELEELFPAHVETGIPPHKGKALIITAGD